MFISSFYFNSLIWVPVSFPSLLVPCVFCFISLFIAFTFSSILWSYPFLWASWLPVFWTLHLIDCLSLHWLLIFLELLSVLSFGSDFFVTAYLLHSKGQSLRYSPGWGNPHCWIVVLYVEERSEKEQCSLLGSRLAFSHFLHYPQVNWALLVLIPGWVGLCTF